MIAFLDTETTGLPVKGAPLDDPAQPHLVQLALLLTEDDGTERVSMSMIVNPGMIIPPGASSVHGITNDVAGRCGISSPKALSIFDRYAGMANLLVAHNAEFDLTLMEIALLRAQKTMKNLSATFMGVPHFCTAKAATPIVNLPPTGKMLAAGFNRPKTPELSECVKHFFNEDIEGAHDALVDVRACARVFFHIRANFPQDI